MGEITIHLPPDLEMGLEGLISRGMYKEKEEAIIALIRIGLNTLRKKEEPKIYMPPEQPPAPPAKPPERWPNHYEFKK